MADFSDIYKEAKARPTVERVVSVDASRPNQLQVLTRYSIPTNMAGPQQYSFPPPPPPPTGPPPPSHQPHQPYGYAPQQQPPQYQTQRGSGAPRGGRGGNQGGRGDYHAPYNPQQPNAGYDPQHPQGPPTGYNGPNGQPSPAPYIGPQAPGPQGQQGGYSGAPQWQNNQHSQQHGPPHHGPPQQHAQQPPIPHTPQPAPLSAQNYHPNYAPQAYQPQQPQYGPQQPQQFQNIHTPSYGHSVPHHQPVPAAPIVWSGPPQHTRPPFNNNRGRGGFSGGRGGHEAPLMGPPIRMGFDNDRGGHSQAGNGFPHQYSNHQSPHVPFSQPPYQGYPPQDFSHGGQRPSLDPNPFNSPQRGRGGGGGGGGHNSNFRGRDRGNFNQLSRGGRNDNRHHQNGNRATSENFHKPAGAESNGKKKKKRRTNTLGLTPNGVDHEDSEDEIDDVDEEARLVTLLGPDTPQLPTDLEAWLAERRAKFPTKARREAAAEELRQRREQNRNGKHGKNNGMKQEEGETKLEKQQRKAEKLRLELEKAERKIQQEISGGKRKRENGDEGDEDRGQVSDDDSNASSSDSDNKPEQFSSRSNGPMRVPPPPKAQLQRHCKYFSTGGTCGKKGKCRFVHDQEVRNQALRDKEANGGKMTLAQRLILNDTAKDDLTILKSIKYLKEKGLMPDQLTGSTPRYDDDLKEEHSFMENLNYGDN